MKKAVFKKPFSDYSANKGFLSNLLTKQGYDKQKINHHINMIKKGFKGEANLNYYLINTFKEIYCLHDVRIKNGEQKSQMDFVVITRDCIWILESKSLSGHTTVCEDGKIIRDNGNSTKHPIVQADIQSNNLKEFLINKNLISEDIEIKHKVVFTDNSDNATVTYNSDEIKKHFIDVELISTLFEDECEEKLSLSDIDKISNCLIRETKTIGETPIKNTDYLLKNNNYYKNKKGYNSKSKQNTKQTKPKKKSSVTSTLIVTVFLFFIWFNYVSPLVDQTMSVLDTPSQQLFDYTEEKLVLGEQRYIITQLKDPIPSSPQIKQTEELMLIADDMNKDELISILKTNYSDYDYAKVTITTSKDLLDCYNLISISTPERFNELQDNCLIGHYTKNTVSENLSDYGKNFVKFEQKIGSFSKLYNKSVNIK